MNTSGSTQYNGFDIAKFVMAILVVIIHGHPLSDISFNLNYAVVSGVAKVAVPYFFMASGFLLFRKMSSLYDLDWGRIKHYLIHIFRLYMVWTVIYLPIIIYTDILHSDKGALHGVLVVIRNTVMNGSYVQLWFLHALLVSAVFVAGLLYFRVSVRKIFILFLFGYLIGLVGLQYYLAFDYFFPEGSLVYKACKVLKYIFVTPRNGFCIGALYFFMGAYLSQKTSQISPDRLKGYIAVFFALLMVEVMGSSFCGLTNHHFVHACYFFLVPFTYYLFLYTKAVKLKDSSVWVYLRKQSMFIFYTHMWWLFLAERFFGTGQHAFVNLGSVGIFVIVLALSILTSHVLIVLSQRERFHFLTYLS